MTLFLPGMSIIGAVLSVYLAYLVIRYPHLRRLAWRSIRNQRRSTVLTIIGLAISTALISMTLLTITALSRSAEQDLDNHYGSIAYDISSRNQPAMSTSLFNDQTIQEIRQEVDGTVLPIVSLPATYLTKNEQGEMKRLSPNVHTIGADAAEAVHFDPSLSGTISTWPQRDEVLLSSQAAASLKAKSGDVIYAVDAANREHKLLVSGVVQERGLTGYPGVTYTNNATAVVSLETVRSLAGIDGSFYTNLLLTSAPPLEWKGAPVRNNFAAERESAVDFFTFFIGMVSLNAILIGVVLVTNIFRLIAEERKGEIGILRTIGLGKADVRRMLMLEGLLCGIFSGIIGVVIGWLLAFLFLFQITSTFKEIAILNWKSQLISDPFVPLSGLSFGLLIIFICVMFIAGKTAKQSIVDAIQPVPYMQPKNKKDIIRNAWLFIMAILILVSFSILFAMPDIRLEWIAYDRIPIVIAILFLSISLLALITVQLLPFIGRGFLYVFRNMARTSLIIRLAVRNLITNPLRTGLILFMFAAISCFISVALLYSSSMEQIMNHDDPITLTGGHELAARDWRPLDSESIVRQMKASDEYDHRLDSFQIAAVQQLTRKSEWNTWGEFQLKVNGIDRSFAESNDIPLLYRDSAYSSDREAWNELAHNDEAVILSQDLRYHLGKIYDVGEVFEIKIGERSVSKTVIAIASQSGYHPESYGVWISQNVLAELAKTPQEIHSTVFIKLGDHADKDSIGQLTKLLTLQNIHPVTNIVDSERGYYRNMIFITSLVQGFNFAALGIGMTGLIVVMYRLIRQRSRQVGMLRAIGIRSETVQQSLLLEGFFVGSIGIVLGFAAGTTISFAVLSTLFEPTETGPESLAFPLFRILGYLCSALALSLAMSYLPARHAMKIPPTEATRISH